MDKDIFFMKEALREAANAAEENEIPIGAVVVSKGKVISRGHNMVERLGDPSAHAEMIALTAACEAVGGKYLTDCTLYVTVEPCPMCAAALGWAQIGELVYGASDPKRGYTLFDGNGLAADSVKLLHPKTKVSSGVCAEESSALMKEFFAQRR